MKEPGTEKNKKFASSLLMVTTLLMLCLFSTNGNAPTQPGNKNMVFVEGGTFQMGSDDGESDEKPFHSATVSSFWISKY